MTGIDVLIAMSIIFCGPFLLRLLTPLPTEPNRYRVAAVLFSMCVTSAVLALVLADVAYRGALGLPSTSIRLFHRLSPTVVAFSIPFATALWITFSHFIFGPSPRTSFRTVVTTVMTLVGIAIAYFWVFTLWRAATAGVLPCHSREPCDTFSANESPIRFWFEFGLLSLAPLSLIAVAIVAWWPRSKRDPPSR
jgi:hypothetical protein